MFLIQKLIFLEALAQWCFQIRHVRAHDFTVCRLKDYKLSREIKSDFKTTLAALYS